MQKKKNEKIPSFNVGKIGEKIQSANFDRPMGCAPLPKAVIFYRGNPDEKNIYELKCIWNCLKNVRTMYENIQQANNGNCILYEFHLVELPSEPLVPEKMRNGYQEV